MFDWLPILGSIILVDLVLSGDNALVIGAVAAGIEANQRWIAFLVGGGGAIVLRILLTYSVTLLLQIPYIEMIGGVLLLIITIRLLIEQCETKETSEGQEKEKKRFEVHINKNNLFGAMLTILIADVTTSLDNIIAIAALAKYQTTLLIIGLLVSIVLLLAGSALISVMIKRLPWLMFIAATILAITAASMIASDKDVWNLFPNEQHWWPMFIYIATFTITIFVSGYFWLRERHFFKKRT